MAILYGTTGDGETLKVLVDQFGNLLAKGIEGPQGPEGPPGIGQLPPDPFEGAILGWEDGELSWLGGSVPLPAGTYGPYVYDSASGSLAIPQDASDLVSGQQIYMSDLSGAKVEAYFPTDTIANVAQVQSGDDRGRILTFTTAKNFDKFAEGDVVQDLWNQSAQWSSDCSGAVYGPEFSYEKSFDGQFDTRCSAKQEATVTFSPATAIPCSRSLRYFQLASGTSEIDKLIINGNETYIGGGVDLPAGGEGWRALNVPASKVITSISWNRSSGNRAIDPAAYEVDGKILVDQSLPTTDVATITAIDPANRTFVVSAGYWYGADGSGDPNGDTRIIGTCSGAGSVFLGTDGTIILRENNQEWVDDFYVTAPEQRIAARKVLSNAHRRKTK